LAKYYSGYQIEKDEIGGTCGMHGRDEKYRILVRKPEKKMNV
jgi:hypothetical protein